jgi:hypothetical protein
MSAFGGKADMSGSRPPDGEAPLNARPLFLPTYSRLRRSMNFAKAIPPKRKTHSTSNTAMLFAKFSTLFEFHQCRSISSYQRRPWKR